jgi:very-short-patch-repair endonuclease
LDRSPRDFRRALRRAATPAERRLWSIVRDGRLGGLKVRRQHTIGPYTVDFFVHGAALAVELDGSVHDDPARAAYDAERTQALALLGVRVLRFVNAEVMEQPERVAAAILAAAGRAA